MKTSLFLIITNLIFTLNPIAQEMYPMKLFQINHYDYFTYMDSEPNEKNWSFELAITPLSENTYQACYSKELIQCLFHLNEYRQANIFSGAEGICFIYEVDENNQIIISDNKEATAQLNQLLNFKPEGLSKRECKSLRNNIKFLLEDGDFLKSELSREISLIHEFDHMDIPIGVAGKIKEEDSVDFEKLTKEEKGFLQSIDWQRLQEIRVYKTLAINKKEFLFDFMFGVQPLTSDVKMDFYTIINEFFNNTLIVSKHNNVTLNRDQRHLNQENKKLSYLLKERRTVTEKMRKITSLEIELKK